MKTQHPDKLDPALPSAEASIPPPSLPRSGARCAGTGQARHDAPAIGELPEPGRYLAQIESGAGNPSVSVLRAITQALDLPAAALPGARRAHGRAAPSSICWRRSRKELPRSSRRSRRASPSRWRGPGAAHPRSSVAGRRQIDARAHAHPAPRLALHRTRPPRRGGLRRQHPRSDQNGRHRDVPPAGAERTRARDRRERAAIITTAGGIVSRSRDLRPLAASRAHDLDQGAAGRT